MNQIVADKLKGPAMGLIATAVIGSLTQIVSLLANVLGAGLGAMGGGDGGGMLNLFSGGVGILFNLIGLAVAGLIGYGAMQMMKVTKYNLCMAASVVAIIPCVSPCCIIGLPIGIWALVVLNQPDVKAAFVD